MEQDKTPLHLSVDVKAKVLHLGDTQIALNELVPKFKAITDARGGVRRA